MHWCLWPLVIVWAPILFSLFACRPFFLRHHLNTSIAAQERRRTTSGCLSAWAQGCPHPPSRPVRFRIRTMVWTCRIAFVRFVTTCYVHSCPSIFPTIPARTSRTCMHVQGLYLDPTHWWGVDCGYLDDNNLWSIGTGQSPHVRSNCPISLHSLGTGPSPLNYAIYQYTQSGSAWNPTTTVIPPSGMC